ncbi:alanine/ornithine racemase family PLP-dependent enzyme [Nitriliruptor alkaliphilus]|uniref:alanine/ornithine racemase family PLP-dependent enzyme n=1 Tax=Nitriliruptor alkaliphilus TaxID=427918 RepID=UPI0006972AA6|nr:alanine/ornithine racemase family PLP-dependent enzyme [Nitriliruptor alkaliphilus]
MTAPRLEIRLDAITHNARTLVDRLGRRGIAVTGVTKAALGRPDIAHAMVDGGIRALGDSRIENIEALRRAGVEARMTLLRTPMLSQVHRVVRRVDVSYNTELEVIVALASEARRRGVVHRIVLMVELGDLREGVLPVDLGPLVREILDLRGVTLIGLGANLACRSGVVPDAAKMAELSALATSIELATGARFEVVSGGNSANLDWALGDDPVGRIDDLRLGEAILLGREPLQRRPIEALHTDAFTLVGEVIESRIKPSLPWGRTARTAFGPPAAVVDRGPVAQTIVALGQQDTDPQGLQAPEGIEIVGASSDHLVLTSATVVPIGTELRFQPDYSALLRAMTSPTVVDVTATQPLRF